MNPSPFTTLWQNETVTSAPEARPALAPSFSPDPTQRIE
eukprot:CAMPEP_0174911030 /NCGR_PEP_ID=MMETSP0167-20121228/75046_1 /TAXON_ID=38298 /ORGANISM="Rhodella maculata, Strain CCMP736" /LENGTH=38 /DNA_ID= /DNA_START= /DNA_END= /DNA_ORIENTATION=